MLGRRPTMNESAGGTLIRSPVTVEAPQTISSTSQNPDSRDSLPDFRAASRQAAAFSATPPTSSSRLSTSLTPRTSASITAASVGSATRR